MNDNRPALRVSVTVLALAIIGCTRRLTDQSLAI
jgi:hypothetical protein